MLHEQLCVSPLRWCHTKLDNFEILEMLWITFQLQDFYQQVYPLIFEQKKPVSTSVETGWTALVPS